MSGGVHRKGPGRGWVYRWIEDVNGKAVRRTSQEFKTKRMAEAARDTEAEILAEKKSVRRARRSGLLLPFTTVLDRWKNSREADGTAAKEYTATVVRILGDLAKDRTWSTVADITAADVDAWRSDRKGTGRRTISYLKSVLRYARRILRQPVYVHKSQTLLNPPVL